jgi:L,D-transpeptidase catalytic domain/Putative peptidoglycan binding domain
MRRPVILIIATGLAVALLAPAAAAAGPRITIVPQQVGRGQTVLAGAPWRVTVVMRPYVAGQVAGVGLFRHGHQLKGAVAPFAPAPGGIGVAVVPVGGRSAGPILVRAAHLPTPQLGALKAKAVRVHVRSPRASLGSRGPVVALLQGALHRLGYVVGARGRFDARTARGVLAFRKFMGMSRTEVADARVFRALARGKGAFHVRFPRHGRHVEADLSRQVLALIDGAEVRRILTTSSGKPSTPTVLGQYRVYSKTPGTNSEGMLDSNYFIRGYAIHGYPDVPVFAASHGCLRIDNVEAPYVFGWLHGGDRVDVYP